MSAQASASMPPTAPWTLALGAGQARRLPAVPRTRWLRVVEGRLWLTASVAAPRVSEDLWLAAGHGWRIAPGVEVVVEGWPSAGLELLEGWAQPGAR